MEYQKITTKINVWSSAISYILFVINQLCNLRFLGLWAVWNLSGYAYALLIGPLAIVISVICLVISIHLSVRNAGTKKYIIYNAIFVIINFALVSIGFLIKGVYTWA